MSGDESLPSGAIAIIGLACRLPGADSPDELWRNLRSGTESITFFTAEELEAAGVDPVEFRQPGYVAAKGVVDQADGFDAGFFGLSPREAAFMDPQQRIFLECAWTALEDAGYDSRDGPEAVGVFAGSILSIYLLQNLWPNRELVAAAGNFQTAVGNDPTFLATSAAYHLDLRGPSVSVGTACSTSLVAVHLACQSLLAYESDMALAGGVSVHLPLVGGYRYEDGGLLSPDGHCRPFDAAARGTVSSDGAGVVVLKRLEEAVADGDCIHAVIRGSAINNDGSLKVGFTAPSVTGEARAISEALAMADVEPKTLSMVETHGAGTILGDPIEFAALAEAFEDCDGQRQFCALGSVKSNIGHVDAAAAVAGLIKTVLALRHREIPPTLHFRQPNPQIELDTSPFYVNDRLRAMPRGESPLRAGVSSFGIGGTNAHVVLEEAPRWAQPAADRRLRPFDLLLLSARTSSALETATDRLAKHLEQNPGLDLADVAFTLRRGRRAFEHRRILVCRQLDDAVAALANRDPQRLATAVAPSHRPAVTFMFPGLGDHYPGMGWELYCTEPVFRDTIDRCAGLLRERPASPSSPSTEPAASDLRDILYPGRDWSDGLPDSTPDEVLDSTGDEVLDSTRDAVLGNTGDEAVTSTGDAAPSGGPSLDLRAILLAKTRGVDDRPEGDRPAAAQPAIFVTEVALAELLRSWGVEPEAMIGHSIGEFAAAYLSGVLTLADALDLVATRAQLIQSLAQPGAMLAVPLGEQELRPLLGAGLSLGAVNRSDLCIAAGEASAIGELEARLADRGVSSQRLRSTHAYHSAMMQAIVEPLTAVLRRIELRAPGIPYVSCMTGTWISDEEATDPGYWAHHLCGTVRFQEGLSLLLDDPRRILLEVGPGQTLASHAISERSRLAECQNPVISTMRRSYDRQPELAALLHGIGRLWLAGGPLDASTLLSREQQRRVPLPTYPFERQRHWIDPPAAGAAASTLAEGKRPDVAEWFYLPCWKPSVRPRPGGRTGGVWLLFIDPHGVGKDLARRLRADGEDVATVAAGEGFSSDGDAFVIDPRRSDDYEALLRALRQRQQVPRTVVHLWCLDREESAAPSSSRFAALQETGYYSVMRLLRALLREGLESSPGVESLRVEVVANRLHEVHGDAASVPEKATLRAPLMVAPQEHPGVVCRSLDTDIPAADRQQRDALVNQLMDEIRGEAVEPTVAYRRGRRWVLAYEQVRLEAADAERAPLRQRGVYVLTGGLGGVGRVLAHHLARTVQARLVLIGRSEFPPRAGWQRWLAEHDESDSIHRKIRQLQSLEALGSEVLVLRADVSSAAAMRRALAAVDERFGEIHGVIHGAGAVGIEAFREIREANRADSERQFVAKVHGVLVLDRVLADRRLDFCLLMSSLSAVLGGLGFAAYGAANLFMDAFARWKNRHGSTRWTSVDWDSWRLADVQPIIAGLGATVNEFVMEPEEGAAACERILAEGNLSQVVVSSGDLQARLRQWIERDSPSDEGSRLATLHQRPNLSAPYEAPRGELEHTLTEIWQELFGVQTVGVNDNFYELGGHSLLATQLNARLHSKLQVEMSLATLLQAPTIAELAVAVVNKQAEKTDPATLERLLAEVGELSQAETERWLTEDDSARVTARRDD